MTGKAITIDLNGKWKVRPEPLSCTGEKGLARAAGKRSGWIAARVPGEIHIDLIRTGEMEEPLVSLNARKCRWVEKKSWWYRRTFNVSGTFLRHERRQIVFDGLDLYAQIFLNGTPLGESKNAFVPAVFDVRHKLRKGRNTLVVRLAAGDELVPKELRPKPPQGREIYGARRRFAGISRLRKPQFTYGWDWVDTLPNIGIWRGVRLEGRSGIVLDDIRLDTCLHAKSVFLKCAAVVENLHPWSERPGRLDLKIKPPSGKMIVREIPFDAPVGLSPVECFIKIPNPQLWWPNGMGEQPLYRVTARVFSGGSECDKQEMCIGLRTVEIDRSRIKTGGRRFCIQINGRDVFCKGANWIPADAIIARVDRKKCETLISGARDAHINMLRIWGGGVYEDPAFYGACDRAGILIWQDFMFACTQYPDDDPHFRAAVRSEAEAVVKSLRHHPCIALWCGNNENIEGFADWWNKGKDIGDRELQIGGSIIYNRILPEVCRALDPERPYWPGSPFGGKRPNCETEGDCHWWSGFAMSPDINRRISHEVFDECRARFVSEYGVIGPCHIDSVKRYLKPSERYPGSRAWKEHTNSFENKTVPAAIRLHYADPEDLSVAEYILYGQMFQATIFGHSFEALRFRKHDPRDDCEGALIWMYHDCWGETGWSAVDYYLRRKPSYYWTRSALAPVKAIVRRRGRSLVTRVVNDTLKERRVRVHYGRMRVDGTRSRMKSKKITVPANGMKEIGSDRIPSRKVMDPREWIYTAYLAGRGIDSCPSIWTFAPHRELDIPDAAIRVGIKGRDIQLISDVYCHGVHCEDAGRPVFSDNYFDLLPGVRKSVRCLAPKAPKNPRFHGV